jgi:tetratricopeptide (TPR) repeat protein
VVKESVFSSKAEKVKPDSYNISIFKSVKQFSEGKIDESLASLRKARKYARNDGTWRYNEAFILMYQEKWEEAQKTYKRISETSFPTENTTLTEVIEFNEKYSEENPDFLQSLYILGYLNYLKLIIFHLELKYFE